ncbi:MAG TPA: NUDIX domain-containing protein [Clostridia bacterium]
MIFSIVFDTYMAFGSRIMTEYIRNLRRYVGHDPLIQCGTSVIILDRDNRVLMIRRTDNDCWCFPGGGIEPGESVEETAAREVFEGWTSVLETAACYK